MSDEKPSLASSSRKLYIRVGDESVEWSLALDAPAMLELLDELAVLCSHMSGMLNVVGVTEPDGPVGKARALLDKHGRG